MPTNLPRMGTYPLVNDGHASIFQELQVLSGRLKPHHVWQQPLQLPQFYKMVLIKLGVEAFIVTIIVLYMLQILIDSISNNRLSYYSIIVIVIHIIIWLLCPCFKSKNLSPN